MDELKSYLDEISAADPKLAQDITLLHNLERVLAWLPQRGIAISASDMVTQDEFCHDLLVAVDTSRVLSFALT